MEGYFFWNGPIRLFMETFFEMVLALVLNMDSIDWSTPFYGVRYSTALTLISLCFVSGLFPFLTILYFRNFSILAEEKFKNKLGAGMEGTNLKKKVSPRSILFYPLIFFGRRIIFVLSAVFLGDFLFVQLLIQAFVSSLVLVYLVYYRPLESPFANRMEIMNECTVLLLLYCLVCFSDFVPSEETRYLIGYVYMAVNLINILIHLSLLLLGSCYKMKLVCKRNCRCCRRKATAKSAPLP